MEGTPNALSITNLTVSYGKVPVLRGVSLEIPSCQNVCIVGPNGAGKSTLLKAVLGLVPRDTGEVEIFGDSSPLAYRQIAYLPQRSQIDWDFPVTVRDVVRMGRYSRLGAFRWFGREDRRVVEEALEQMGIGDLADRHIRLLSGGQQQRVFIARALVQEARILFMDEPFVGVDATTQESILALIQKLKAEGKTILMVNHDLEILDHFDLLVMLNKQLIAFGPPEEVYNERNHRLTYGGLLSRVDRAEMELWRAKR
ncbi:MAG: ABC transporter ATP-binding protein [Planctomycetota bacterium]|nr:MAG: ABC transporter ATP-binding protein [Planctomycetota bacterium]